MILAFPGIEDNFFTLTLFLQNLANALANGAVYAPHGADRGDDLQDDGPPELRPGRDGDVHHVRRVRAGRRAGLARLAGHRRRRDRGDDRRRGVRAHPHPAVGEPQRARPVILTLGLFFILNGGAATIWGTQPRTPIPAPFPGALDDKIDIITDRVPNFFITYKAFGVWVTVGVLVILLNLLLQRTKLGLAYRAVAANAESALIVGIPVKRMLMLGWALAAGIGAIAGAIIAQYRNVLDFNFMGAVLLFGFAAACVGGFDSIKGAVVGGLLVGIVETFAPALFTFVGNELALVMVLLVILIVLYFRPQGLFGSKRVERV